MVLKGLATLIDEIGRCHKADATTATACMVYVCIDTLAFLVMPAAQKVQVRNDFIRWVDDYLRADPSQPYRYRGDDVYAARCALLHKFGAEADAHSKDPSVRVFFYSHDGPHVFKPTEDARHVAISVAALVIDLAQAIDRFVAACNSDPDLWARVRDRLPAIYATYFYDQ
jgi:hypothetical protein